MAFSKPVMRPIVTPHGGDGVHDDYKYYKIYVQACVQYTHETAIQQYLKLNTALYRMLEVILEKLHDIDAKNSIAGDIIFHAIALSQALHIELHIEDGRGDETRRKDATLYASDLCLNAKTASAAYLKLRMDHNNKSLKEELRFELGELIDAAHNVADVHSLHELLEISLQRGGKTDKLLEERFAHMRQTPYMKPHIERTTIYPLLYSLPTDNPSLYTLLTQAGVNIKITYHLLEEIVDRIHSYALRLMDVEIMTERNTEQLLTNVFAQRTFPIVIRDIKTLICPISRCLRKADFATVWNSRYHRLGLLSRAQLSPSIEERCQNLREDILNMRVPQGWDINTIFQQDTIWRNSVRDNIVNIFKTKNSVNQP